MVDPTEVGPGADDRTEVPPPAPGGGPAGPGFGGRSAGGSAAAPAGPAPAPSRRRERSPLAGVLLGAGLVVAGLGWALTAADVIPGWATCSPPPSPCSGWA